MVRLEAKIAVVKASLGPALPAAAQLAEMRGKCEKAKEKLKATKARMSQLADQEREIYDEMDRLKDLITELEDHMYEDEEGGPPWTTTAAERLPLAAPGRLAGRGRRRLARLGSSRLPTSAQT